MPEGLFVAYYRVSTDRQGRSGLGLDAQHKTVADFLNSGSWTLVGEFLEVESGKVATRPRLEEALALCRVMRAALLVANVSRLTRSVAFLSKLLEAGVEVRFCDLPKIEGPTGRFLLQQMAAVAELEAGLISDRTKKALAAAKARGQKLGNPGNLRNRDVGSANGKVVRIDAANRRAADLAPIIAEVRKRGAVSLREIAAGLNDRGVFTAKGKPWSAVQVQRVLARIPV